MKGLWIIICLLVAGAGPAAADRMTIDQAVGQALENNVLIQQGEALRQAANFGEKEARADFYPRLTTAYSYRNLAESPYVQIAGNRAIVNSTDQHHWDITLTQPLFTGRRITARHNLAELGLEGRQLELEQTRQAIALQVKQACYDLLMVQKTKSVAESSEAALAAHEADARQFHANGLAPLNDLLKAQVARAEATQRLARARAGVREAQTALCLLMGRDYTAAVTIADSEPAPPPTRTLEGQVQQALKSRPEIALLEKAIRSKDNEQLLASSDYYPSVDLAGTYQQDGDDPGASHNDYTNQYNASVSIQARWTLFEFGKTRARAAKTRAERGALEKALLKAKDDIRLQVVRARLAVDVASVNMDTAKTALDQAREHWRITNSLYGQQLTTSTEVLDARSYLDRAQSAYHEARYGYGSALARLQWAMGGSD